MPPKSRGTEMALACLVLAGVLELLLLLVHSGTHLRGNHKTTKHCVCQWVPGGCCAFSSRAACCSAGILVMQSWPTRPCSHAVFLVSCAPQWDQGHTVPGQCHGWVPEMQLGLGKGCTGLRILTEPSAKCQKQMEQIHSHPSSMGTEEKFPLRNLLVLSYTNIFILWH